MQTEPISKITNEKKDKASVFSGYRFFWREQEKIFYTYSGPKCTLTIQFKNYVSGPFFLIYVKRV